MTWLAIVGAGIATYLIRLTPLLVTGRGPAPRIVRAYLDALPIAVLAALAGSAVAAPGGVATTGGELLAGLVTLGATLWRRNLLAGVLSGVAAIAAFRALS